MQQNLLRRHVRVSAQLQPAKLLGSASPIATCWWTAACLSGRAGFRRLRSELPPAGDPREIPAGRGGTIRHPDRDHPGHPGSDLDPVHLLRHGPRNPLGGPGPAENGTVSGVENCAEIMDVTVRMFFSSRSSVLHPPWTLCSWQHERNECAPKGSVTRLIFCKRTLHILRQLGPNSDDIRFRDLFRASLAYGTGRKTDSGYQYISVS